MDRGRAIMESLIGESSQCTLCRRKTKESTLLPCSHRLCLACYKNYTSVLGDVEDDFQCPNGCECCPVSAIRCPTELGSLSPERDNICNGEKELGVGDLSEIDFSQVVCSSCDATDATATACCDECEGFLCQDCVRAHAKLRRLMKSHHVVSLEDLMSGKAEIKPKQKRCSAHPDEKVNFFCTTCRLLVCPQCAVIRHPKPDHDCVELKTAHNKFEKVVGDLATKCETKLRDVMSQLSQIERSKHEVGLEINTVEQIINTTAEEMIEAVNAERQKLLAEVHETKSMLMTKMDTLHEANQCVVDRLNSAKKLLLSDGKTGLQLEHSRADAFFSRFDEILARKQGDGEMEEVKEYVRRIGFKRAVSSCEQMTSIGELFQLSEWEIYRQFELESSISTMTAFPDGRIAIACEDDEEGLMMVLTNSSKERVLDGVKVEHAAALSDGRFVIIDREDHLRLFSSQGRENPAVYYDRPGDLPEESFPVCVTQGSDHKHILVGFSDSPACYEYPIFGAKPVAKIATGSVCPRQIVTIHVEDEFRVIAVNSKEVVAVDASGSILWHLEENDANALVPAVFNDQVFIASTQSEDESDDGNGTYLTIDRYTADGKLIESLVQAESVTVDKELTTELQMTVLSKAKLAVSVGDKCLVFHGPQTLSDITEDTM